MRLVLLFSLIALPAVAAPSWAGKSDSADEKGSLFICSGEGKNEQDALDSALALCNDKICKLCGVEVESTTTTNETLKGVDLSRKVVERCRRVRKAEPQLRSKSLECDDGKCQAYIQLFYSKETQKAECSAYANEDFADPAKCEADIEAFRQQQGLSAAAMRKRDGQLGAALSHCAQIDVRPTPALLALDEKLRVGLGNLGRPERGDPRYAEEFMASGDTMQQIAENKTLLGRIGLARGLVANKVLLLDVLEAAQAEDLDAPAGLARLLKAYRAAPLGSTYGAPDAHFFYLGSVAELSSDLRPIADFLRTAYQPEKPPSGLNGNDWNQIARTLAADHQVTPAEWEWGVRTVRARQCSTCLRPLVAAPQPADLRVARLFEGVGELRAAFGANHTRKDYGIYELLPAEDPAFVLKAEAAAPPELKPFFDFEIYGHVVGSFRSTQAIADQDPARRRWAEKAALPGRDGDLCRELSRRLEALKREEAPRVPALDETVCSCLDSALAKEDRYQKKIVLQYALDGRLACVEAP